MTAPTQTNPTSTVALAATARQVQLTIRAAVMQAVARLWPLLDPKRLDATWPAWLAAMRAVINAYHAQSSQAAAMFYQAARTLATSEPTPTGLIKLAALPDERWVERALGYAAPGTFDREVTRPGTALSTTLGTSARIVLDGGRTTTLQTTAADPRAVGYYRVTDGAPCAFCAMLAGRGVVYHSQRSGGFQAHNDCGCSAAPAFSRDQPLPQVNETAAAVYEQHARGHRDPLAVFRKAWTDHQSAS